MSSKGEWLPGEELQVGLLEDIAPRSSPAKHKVVTGELEDGEDVEDVRNVKDADDVWAVEDVDNVVIVEVEEGGDYEGDGD